MKRRLTAREVYLLVMLLILAMTGGYFTLFYLPMKDELERLKQEKISCEEQIEPATLKVEDKNRMKRELEEIFAENPEPLGLSPYDNQKPVMRELNNILKSADSYNLSFSTVDSVNEDGIVRRRISMGFTSSNYDTAKEVLQKLHDSDYRCMLDDLNVSLGANNGEETVSVNVTLVFFEYKDE